MFDVSQTPTPISGAYLVQTSRSSEDRECQEIGRKQAASDTASSHSTLPRIPASVKLPAQSNHTSESLQPSRTYQGNGSAKEQWRPEPSHIDMAENEKEEGGRYHQQVSLQHASTDPEKAYSQQSPEQFYGHSLSRPYHTTIRYEADDMEDESTAEEHSVWILVSCPLNLHHLASARQKCLASPTIHVLTRWEAIGNPVAHPHIEAH